MEGQSPSLEAVELVIAPTMGLCGNGDKFALVVLLCYGLFKEIRPSEPFLTEYLIDSRWVNLTKSDLYAKVYPVYTYSYFALLVPVFLLTDFLRYKPVVAIEGASYVATWVLLLWAKGVPAMQTMQFMYGIASSTEVAYYTYIYAKVDPSQFKKVSSITRSVLLFGRFTSGLLSQVLTSTGLLDYRQLNIVSLSSVCMAFLFSLVLPPVSHSIYFHKNTQGEQKVNEHVLSTMKKEAITAYSNSYVVKWSLWAALSTCVNLQVGNYIQGLWEEVRPSVPTSLHNSTDVSSGNEDEGEIYNGAIEAAATLLGSLVVLSVSYWPVNWKKVGDYAIVLVCLLSAGLLIWMSQTEEIWVAYIGYIVYRMSYQLLMTVASFEIVQDLPRDSYGLIFGINFFVGLGIQTILTSVVADKLEFPPRDQFIVYGGFFALPLLITLCFKFAACRRRNSASTDQLAIPSGE